MNPREYDYSAERYIRKVTWVGFGANLLLAGVKFLAGFAGRSHALVADGVHSLSDTATDIAVIVGSHFWTRPPDEDHPYGHGRVETLVTIFIGVMLLGAGVGIGWEAVSKMQTQQLRVPRWPAGVTAAASILLKEILYRWTAAAGARVRSPALVANAWHHRSDAISSLPVLVAVAGAMIYPAWAFLDLIGAVIVSIFILHSAFKIVWPGLAELIDSGAPADTRRKIKRVALQTSGVREVHEIRTRYISASIQVELHIVVDASISVRSGHAIAENVRERIVHEIPEVLDVVVHVDPAETASPEQTLPDSVE